MGDTRKIKKIGWLIKDVNASRTFRPLILQIVDIIVHKIRINTSPVDYYRYQFYKKGKTWEEKSRFIGKRGSSYYPYEKNLIKYIPLFDNKYLFKKLAESLGISQARLIGTIGENYTISQKEELKKTLEKSPCDIVLKPIQDSGGRGVIVLENRSGVLFRGEKKLNIDDLWQEIGASTIDYLIEERVRQNHEIAKLHPFSLNTFRIFTVKTDDNEWHVMGKFLRIGNSGNVVDNLSSGGILVCLDDEGKTFAAYDFTSWCSVEKHPMTNERLEGISLFCFEEIVNTALSASRKFNFMGTMGWDIAYAEDGPIVVECNPFYDCDYFQMAPSKPLITKEIAKKLKRRSMWNKWQKDRIYPDFNRWRITA